MFKVAKELPPVVRTLHEREVDSGSQVLTAELPTLNAPVTSVA